MQIRQSHTAIAHQPVHSEGPRRDYDARHGEKPGAALPLGSGYAGGRGAPSVATRKLCSTTATRVDRAYAGTSADIYGNVQQNARRRKYNDNYEYEEEYVRSQNSNRASKIILGIVAAVVFVAVIVGVIYLVKGKGANSGSGFLSFLPGFSTSSTTSDEIVLPKFVGMIYASDIEGNSEYADLTFEITYGNVPSKQRARCCARPRRPA